MTADREHSGAGRHERCRGVEPERAIPTVIADRAADGCELGPEIVLREGPAGLLGPADVVDAVEGDEIEEGLAVNRVVEAEESDDERDGESGETHPRVAASTGFPRSGPVPAAPPVCLRW
jgi:hypothetical protein